MTRRKADLTIGAMARGSGVKIETIRYYERVGLMLPPPRSAGGHRLYGHDHLRRLCFIRRSRKLGFSLEEVRVLLNLVEGGNYTCGEVESIALRHLKEVRAKIADLRRLERTLSRVVADCEGGEVPDCPIIEALFKSPGLP